jgi:hypothetical protein
MNKIIKYKILGIFIAVFCSLMITSPAQALDWTKISDSTIGDYGGYSNFLVFEGELYLSIDYWIFKYDGSDWDLIYTSSDGQIRSMEDYDGDIYIGVNSGVWGVGAKVYQYDGSSWNQVNDDGFGSSENYIIASMVSYDGKLYAGTTNGDSTGLEVWEYNGSDWTRVGNDGINDSDNVAVEQMAVHNGKLYLTTNNSDTGTQVLEYDGSNWTQVNVGGFGDVNDYGAQAIISYNGKLYVGTNQRGRVWEYDGTDWTQINLDRFGDWDNVLINSFEVYDDKLYASTFNENDGLQIWEYDGSNWIQANESGFGNSLNALGGIGKWLGVYDNKIMVIVAEWNHGSYENTQVWSALSPNLVDDEEEDDEEENEKAHIDSWKAYQYENPNVSCNPRLKLTIKGKHFDKDAKVKIGGKEASSVNRISSKKITAKFCLKELLEIKTDPERNVSVINPETDKEKADKKINLNDLSIQLTGESFNMSTSEDIKNIQRVLVKLGFLDQQYITGVYGPLTTEAVRKFQEQNGIEQTGLVGPKTKAKLEEMTK